MIKWGLTKFHFVGAYLRTNEVAATFAGGHGGDDDDDDLEKPS